MPAALAGETLGVFLPLPPLPLFLLYPLNRVGDGGSEKEGRLGPDVASKAGGKSTVSEAGGRIRCCLFLATSWLEMEGALQLVLQGKLSRLCPYLLFAWLLCVGLQPIPTQVVCPSPRWDQVGGDGPGLRHSGSSHPPAPVRRALLGLSKPL